MPIGVTGAAILGAGALTAGASIYGSSQAAGAAKDAAGLQARQQNAAIGRSAPFVSTGSNAAGLLDQFNAAGTAGQPNYLQMSQDALPGQMTQAQLEQTPGYQFQLQQGLQATQNSAAARGLGVSGAALKGAATFATGLANSNYQTQFNNAQTRSQDYLNLNTANQANTMNTYNRLAGTTAIGANAASGVSSTGFIAAAAGGNYLNQAGLASAAGASGIGSAATSGANNYLTSNYLRTLQGGNANGGIYGSGFLDNVNGSINGQSATV